VQKAMDDLSPPLIKKSRELIFTLVYLNIYTGLNDNAVEVSTSTTNTATSGLKEPTVEVLQQDVHEWLQ
jgi:hypothetical protein